jgi:hypothetical protein
VKCFGDGEGQTALPRAGRSGDYYKGFQVQAGCARAAEYAASSAATGASFLI